MLTRGSRTCFMYGLMVTSLTQYAHASKLYKKCTLPNLYKSTTHSYASTSPPNLPPPPNLSNAS